LATVPAAVFDLDTFLAMPRLANLHLSPDGSRLALTVQTVAADGKRFAGSIWEVSTDGSRPPRRLTWSARGEIARGFLRDGSLLFNWATLPAGDIHAAVDTAVARPDIDAGRMAAMGGSYGGYMANWMAVTTDRFRAIVTHAGVWDLIMERDRSGSFRAGLSSARQPHPAGFAATGAAPTVPWIWRPYVPRPLLMFEKTLFTCWPTTVRTTMTTTAIRTRINAYSVMPCPPSSSCRCDSCRRIRASTVPVTRERVSRFMTKGLGMALRPRMAKT
jgi:hypothetical protein